MASKRKRWQDLDHSQELLYDEVVGRNSSHVTGPIPEFLAKKQAEHKRKTYLWYREALLQLIAFLEEKGLGTVGDFNETNVNLFRVRLREKGASDNTISNRLRAIRAFANWMAENGWTRGYPLGKLKVPQSSKPQFDLIDDGDRKALFSLYPNDTYLGSRNLAMLGLLSDTGLRREELVNIALKNVDLAAGVLKVYADKVSEWRFLPLTDEVVGLLRNYLRWRERYFGQKARPRVASGNDRRQRVQRMVQSDHLFLSWKGTALQPQALGQILYRASKKVGAHLHPHLFRHDWLTRKALDGENPSLVRRWAGHKSYAMTDYYFSVAEDMMGAIKPKRSVLAPLKLAGSRRGRPFKQSST